LAEAAMLELHSSMGLEEVPVAEEPAEEEVELV
jgi:hypothetical protein